MRIFNLFILFITVLICQTAFAQFPVSAVSASDSLSGKKTEGPIKAGTIRVRKKNIDSTAQFLVGYWGFYRDTTLSSKYSWQAAKTTYQFFENGSYYFNTISKGSIVTTSGHWRYTSGRLTLLPADGQILDRGFTSSITWLNSHRFYFREKGIYNFFEKTDSGDIRSIK